MARTGTVLRNTKETQIEVAVNLDDGDVNVYVDVTGLTKGQYELPVAVAIDGCDASTLTIETDPAVVTVTIE